MIINFAIKELPYRPNKYSCGQDWDYPTWEGLTNTRWSGLHRKPVDSPKNLPPAQDVAEKLFERNGPLIESDKSTLLFPYFAQWFTDGFLVADQVDRRRNFSNHGIDLSQLYGLRPETAKLLRGGGPGKLKSQEINGAEWPPFLYEGTVTHENLHQIKDEFRQKRETYEDFADIGAQPLYSADKKQLLYPAHSPSYPSHLLFNELPTIPLAFEKLTGPRGRWITNSGSWFASANQRANSTPAFVMMNTLMLREHNRIATALADHYKNEGSWNKSPEYFDERVFQTTRNILTVIVLKIVINEYINHIAPYHFKLHVDPEAFFKPAPWKWNNHMTVEFNLLYRWHSMIPDDIIVNGKAIPGPETLWNPQLIIDRGLAPMFNDTSAQAAGRIGVKNTARFLAQMTEVPSIQMGRDSRVGSYNDYRELCGMPRVTSFQQISSEEAVCEALKDLYGTVDRIEFYSGIFAEDVRPKSALGPTIGTMVAADAFSQALTNPLLHKNIYKPQTFSDWGWQLIQEDQSIDRLVRRNTKEYHGNLHISMTRKGWSL